jgi:hypothetical protein
VKNRGAAMDDAATSILAGSQWGGDLVLSVGAWWPPGVAFYHITCRTPAAARGVPGGRPAEERVVGELPAAADQNALPVRMLGILCPRCVPGLDLSPFCVPAINRFC